MDKPITDKIISQRADEFAQREYISDSYERDALSKGYYWGYKEADKEFTEAIKTAEDHAYFAGSESMREKVISIINSRISEILGDAQPAPVLRVELRELINKIEEQ